MKKRILILCLAIMMLFTACGKETVDDYVAGMNSEEDSPIYAQHDEENKIILVLFKEGNYITDAKVIEDATMGIYNNFIDNDFGNYTIRLAYDADKDNLIAEIVSGKFTINKIKEREGLMYGEEKEVNSNSYSSDSSSYEFTAFETMIDKIENKRTLLTITVNFTNNSNTAQIPLQSFTKDFSIQQNSTELKHRNTYVPDDYKPTAVELYLEEIQPGETKEVVIAFEVYSSDSVILVDKVSNGQNFKKEISVQSQLKKTEAPVKNTTPGEFELREINRFYDNYLEESGHVIQEITPQIEGSYDVIDVFVLKEDVDKMTDIVLEDFVKTYGSKIMNITNVNAFGGDPNNTVWVYFKYKGSEETFGQQKALDKHTWKIKR